MASFPPFKKSLFRIITVITIICLLVISCTIPASAFSNDKFPNESDFPSVNIPISRPQLDGNTVYAEILTKYGDGTDYRIMVFVFSVYSGVGRDFVCIPSIVDDNHIRFDFVYSGDFVLEEYPQFSCYYYDSNSGFLKYKDYHLFTENDRSHSVLTIQNYGIYGVHYYGMNFTNQAVPSVQKEFVVNYASEGLVLNYLKSLNTNLTNFYGYTMSWFDAFDDNIVDILRNVESSSGSLRQINNYLNTLVEQNDSLLSGYYMSDDDGSSLPPSEEAPPRDDSTIDDIKEAEKDAVGGKTDEEIQQGIEDALDQEKQKEQINAEDIPTSDIEISHNVFNVVFDFMGPAWNSYFILTLTVAFAAFLIGRRY